MTDDVVTTRDYVHLPLDQEVTAIGGSYRLVKEERLEIDGREVLYIIGHGVFDTTCCGAGGCAYAIVPGYIVNWKTQTTEDGLPITTVEPITEIEAQTHISKVIKARETIQETRFV
jgi:hypothetical protein